MALHDRKATAEEILRTSRRLWQQQMNQMELDDILLKILTLTNKQTVADVSAGKVAPQAFRTGLPGLIWREDSAMVTTTPSLHVNAPTDDRAMRKHANQLEAWLQGAMKLSQIGGAVWKHMPGEARAIGRAWSYISAVPSLWADNREYLELVRLMNDAGADGKEDEFKLIQKDILAFKADNFPIRWRRSDSRFTFSTTYSGDVYLPEVIERRMLTKIDFENEYGEKKLPKFVDSKDDLREIEIWTHTNHFIQQVVAAQGNDAAIFHEFEHNLDDSPFINLEGELLPPNDEGLRNAGQLFYVQEMVQAFDQILADLVHNHHQWTLAPLLIYLARDPGGQSVGEKQGRPPKITYGAGQQVRLWAGEEDVKLGPVQEVNPQSLGLLGILRDLIEQAMIRPVRRGEVKAGESDSAVRTSFQIADKEFSPFVEAEEDTYERAAQLHAKSVLAINRLFEDSDLKIIDKVTIHSRMPGRKGVIAVGPRDLRGWLRAFQAISDRAIPQDRGLSTANAKNLVELGVAKEQVLEEELGYENSMDVIDRGRMERLDDELFQEDLNAIMALSGQMFNELTPQQVKEFTENFGDASPAVQQVLSQVAPTITNQPSSNGVTLSNIGRGGDAKNPRAPAGPTLA